MANGTIKEIWSDIDLADQADVNRALKDSMVIISPAVEKVWGLNLKVNIIYAVLTFAVVVTGIIFGVLQLIKDKQ